MWQLMQLFIEALGAFSYLAFLYHNGIVPISHREKYGSCTCETFILKGRLLQIRQICMVVAIVSQWRCTRRNLDSCARADAQLNVFVTKMPPDLVFNKIPPDFR